MPAHGIPSGNQHGTTCECSIAEFGVFASPLRESFVVSADEFEEGARNAEIAARHHTKQIVGIRGQLAGTDHVELDPLRSVYSSASEQVGERAGAVPDSGGVDARHIHMGSKAQREHIARCVMPSSVLGQPTRLGHHVAVQEDDDVVRCCPHARIACARQSEAEVFLMYHADVERRMFWLRER